MDLSLYDAHVHLPEEELQDSQKSETNSDTFRLKYRVINCTELSEWPKLEGLSREDLRVLPALGLHPQNVPKAPENWKEAFLKILDSGCIHVIGEIGIDRRNTEKGDVEKQIHAFQWQLEQARIQNLPTSVHCVKAVGIFMETLRKNPLPDCGIHLHAYTGPAELIPELVELGAYFSFSARQLDSVNSSVRQRILAVPIQRLLIETDKALVESSESLLRCYEIVAAIRKVSLSHFVSRIEENFKRYFL